MEYQVFSILEENKEGFKRESLITSFLVQESSNLPNIEVIIWVALASLSDPSQDSILYSE